MIGAIEGLGDWWIRVLGVGRVMAWGIGGVGDF